MWGDIGQYPGVGATAAEQRFAPDLDCWDSALESPYRLDGSGRERVLRLTSAAHDPGYACRRLGLRARLRLGVWEDDRAVSAALFANDASDAIAGPRVHEMSGWIRRRSLELFLELLITYIRHDDLDWNTVARGVEGTDVQAPGCWYPYPLEGLIHTVNVRLAQVNGEDELSIVVAGAVSAELRLRIDTLMDAFSAGD
ncbi:hypothetical protein [Streptomyces sp. NPDC006274]|uniref:hypothetical protein n=1 Tax=unclassified Streptomyces TaxID=2593676 RepID=UPI0033B16C2D